MYKLIILSILILSFSISAFAKPIDDYSDMNWVQALSDWYHARQQQPSDEIPWLTNGDVNKLESDICKKVYARATGSGSDNVDVNNQTADLSIYCASRMSPVVGRGILSYQYNCTVKGNAVQNCVFVGE